MTEKTKVLERAIEGEKTRRSERANEEEKTARNERAKRGEKTIQKERAMVHEKTTRSKRVIFKERKMNKTDREAVRMLVRQREDFQSMRKTMDARIGRKADGTAMNIEERTFRPEDLDNFATIADAAKEQEKQIEKMLKKTLKRFPIYTDYLEGVKGVGTIAAGWIIAEYDIEKATTVSKLWQFTGLNPSMVQGKKRVENEDGSFSYVLTGQMIRGDKLSPGHVAPFNKRLRTAMVGVLADGFIKAQNEYCMNYYYPYKERLSQEENTVTHIGKDVEWKDVSKGHRDRAAKRYMIKMFLKDLYVAWRTIEGLTVRPSYQEEYLGHKHAV